MGGKSTYMETKEMTQFMSETKRDIEHIRERLDRVPTTDAMKLANRELIQEIFCQADEKYASKNSEKMVYMLAGSMVLYVMNSLLGMI